MLNTATIHDGILWSLFLPQDHDQSMFCDLFTRGKCACFIWHYLEGYPMFFVVFDDGDSQVPRTSALLWSSITVSSAGWSF